MFSELELDYIMDDYKEILDEKMHKHKTISVLLLIAIISLVVSLYMLGLGTNEFFSFLIPIYGGILFVGSLIYVVFSYGIGSKKPFYDIIVSKVIDKINSTMELSLEYSSKKKIEFNHNLASGIFTKHCRASVRMHIKGLSSENRAFDIYELTLVSGGGNSQTTHLNGIYIVTNNSTSVLQQVRTNGRPHLKGTKYSRIESELEYKIFLDEELEERSINEKYISMFSRVMDDTTNQKGYLSTIENETHFALHPFKLYKYRKLTLENLNTVYNKIRTLIELVDKLSIEEL